MPLIKLFWGIFQSLVTMGVLGLSIDYYNPDLLSYEIPPIITQLVIVGVLGVSLFWAIVHVVGGGLLGLAASGVGDGMKMGLLLGLGLGVSRLWPHCLAWGLGNIVAEGPMWHAILLGVLAVVLLGLNSTMRYFWSTIQNGSFGG